MADKHLAAHFDDVWSGLSVVGAPDLMQGEVAVNHLSLVNVVKDGCSAGPRVKIDL